MSKKRILVIDDDASLRAVNAKTLRDGGYEVDSAPSSQSVLAWLTVNPAPDLIFVDLIMPSMDGIEFLKTLHAIP